LLLTTTGPPLDLSGAKGHAGYVRTLAGDGSSAFGDGVEATA
jgi:hypothetical protein